MERPSETTTDIIAEKRRRAEEIKRDCAEKMKRGEMVSDCYARELVADIRREADRLEAALKRESGDCAKLRKALGKLRAELWNNTVIAGKRKFELYEIADAALAAPATAEKSSAVGGAAKLREALEMVRDALCARRERRGLRGL